MKESYNTEIQERMKDKVKVNAHKLEKQTINDKNMRGANMDTDSCVQESRQLFCLSPPEGFWRRWPLVRP